MSSVAEILGTNSVNESENLFKCADRVSPGDDPRDISTIKEKYLPFDSAHSATFLRKNPFGVTIYRNETKAGNVYTAYDGKRLVLEVGCNTVVYIHINPSMPSKHHRLFIQSDAGFSADTTIRKDAAIIAYNTRHVETIVKAEMYFLMGMISTLSIPALIAVTGADITVTYARNRGKAESSGDLAKNLLAELEKMKKYAPTLHAKVWELIYAELENNVPRTAKRIPEDVVTDPKVQAQVSGILFGKWAFNASKGFTLWTVISTLLTQAAIKGSLQAPMSYMAALEGQYKPLLEEMKTVDAKNPATMERPARTLVRLMKESGVEISAAEAKAILREIQSHPQQSAQSLSNITKAIEKFQRTMKD